MSAAELLRHFKDLPAVEGGKFLRGLMARRRKKTHALPTKPVTWPDVEARAKRIVDDRVMPNFVLMARDDAAF